MAENGKPKAGYLARFGERLVENGYKIIPIKRGSKRPPMSDWEKVNSTKRSVQEWVGGKYKMSGVGILTKHTPAVDIDVLDEAVALKLEAWIVERFGIAPVRIGMAPKRLLLFRTDVPFDKINSKTYEDEWGNPELSHSQSGAPTGHLRKVEILGDGQQFVAYAVHPDTGRPYTWTDPAVSPRFIKADDLPTLTEDEAREIVDEFERLAEEAGWTEKRQSRSVSRLSRKTTGVIDHDDAFASDVSRVEDLSEEEIHARLLLVPGAEDHDTWFQIGMALYHQFEGDDRGLEMWHDWSQTAGNYDAAALDHRWSTFDIEGKGRAPVTARLIIKLAAEAQHEIATETFRDITSELKSAVDLQELKRVCDKVKHIEFDVFHRAQIVGIVQKRFKDIANTSLTVTVARDMVRYENPNIKDLPRWLENWVYVANVKHFYSTERRFSVDTEAFNALHGRYMLTKKDVLEGLSTPETSASMFALNTKQIPTVQYMMYMPGEDELFWFNSHYCVNTYSDRNIPELPPKFNADELAAIQTVKGHIKHLFGENPDQAVLMDALAYSVQNPGKRLNWGIMIQGAEGDGKSFFSALLAATLGPDNVKQLQAQALEEKYNAWAEGSQIVFVEEVKMHGHNRFDVLNKVKPLLTNPVVPIRKMQTDWYDAINTATYWLTTNFKDALPLDDGDSRYWIIFSQWQTRAAVKVFEAENPMYFTDLFACLEHAGALRKWLMNHKISKQFSNVRRAPDSAGRDEMVGYAMSEEDEAVKDLLSTGTIGMSGVLLSSNLLMEALGDAGLNAPYGRAMSALLLKHGFSKLGKVFWNGKSHLMWSQEPAKFRAFNKVDPDAVREWLEPDL